MFHCHICGSTKATTQSVREIFQIDNKPVLVEHIPAMVCVRCGEMTFSRETTEQIRQFIYSNAKPVRSISMDVFDFLKKRSTSVRSTT